MYNASCQDPKDKIKSCIGNFDDLFDTIYCKCTELKSTATTSSSETSEPQIEAQSSNLLSKIDLTWWEHRGME